MIKLTKNQITVLIKAFLGEPLLYIKEDPTMQSLREYGWVKHKYKDSEDDLGYWFITKTGKDKAKQLILDLLK